MPNLDIAPNLDAWRTVKRIIARINPKVQDADLEQIVNGPVCKKSRSERFLGRDAKKATAVICALPDLL